MMLMCGTCHLRSGNVAIQASVGHWMRLFLTDSSRVWFTLAFKLNWSFAIAHHTLRRSNVIHLNFYWDFSIRELAHFCSIDKDRYCNYGQMKCIADHGTKTLALETQQNIKSCLSSCTEMHVGFVGYELWIWMIHKIIIKLINIVI